MLVTVKLPACPVVNVASAALVIAGGCSTVNVNSCVASGDTPLAAVIVKGYTPPVPASGVPASVAVPSTSSRPPASVPSTDSCRAPGSRCS